MFQWPKAFNPVHLFEFVTVKLEAYYVSRLADAVNGKMAYLIVNDYENKIEYLKITKCPTDAEWKVYNPQYEFTR